MQRTSDHSEADVVLIEKNGRFFFFQPDIGVIASDDGIEGAYGKFSDARRAFWNELAQSGLTVGRAGAVAGPSRAGRETVAVAEPGRRGMVAELGLFLAKVCIVFALIGGIGAMLGLRAASAIATARDQVSTALEQVKMPNQISLADVSRKAADIVKDIQSLTKEEKESLLRSVATISRELDPVVDAWRNPPAR